MVCSLQDSVYGPPSRTDGSDSVLVANFNLTKDSCLPVATSDAELPSRNAIRLFIRDVYYAR